MADAASASLPLVSVVIPVYNHAAYVETAIKSVTDQTYPNIELIVIDDGSKDASPEVLRRYVGREGMTVILNEKNRGQSAVYNQALSLAKGEFICMLASDDWFLPEKIEKQVRRFQACGPEVGVVYTLGARYYEEEEALRPVKLPLLRGDVLHYLLERGNFIFPVTPMMRTECFRKVRPDESFRAEGEAIYQRLAMYWHFDYVGEVLAVMRDHPGNTGNRIHMLYDEMLRYIDMVFAHPDLPPQARRLKPRRLAHVNSVKGMQFIGEARDFRMGRTAILRALRHRPSFALRPQLLAALAVSFLPAPAANWVMDRLVRPAHVRRPGRGRLTA